MKKKSASRLVAYIIIKVYIVKPPIACDSRQHPTLARLAYHALLVVHLLKVVEIARPDFLNSFINSVFAEMAGVEVGDFPPATALVRPGLEATWNKANTGC